MESCCFPGDVSLLISPSFTLSEHMFSSILKCSLPTFFNSQLFFFPWKTALGAEHEGKNGTNSVPLGRYWEAVCGSGNNCTACWLLETLWPWLPWHYLSRHCSFVIMWEKQYEVERAWVLELELGLNTGFVIICRARQIVSPEHQLHLKN